MAHRYFYALDMDSAVQHVTNSCYLCAALSKTPHTIIEQDTTEPPAVVDISFTADVLRRECQLILVVRECVTSFTITTIIESEHHETLREVLLRLCVEIRPHDGPKAVIRTDAATGFQAHVNDEQLHHQGLTIKVGRVKNANKNANENHRRKSYPGIRGRDSFTRSIMQNSVTPDAVTSYCTT